MNNLIHALFSKDTRVLSLCRRDDIAHVPHQLRNTWILGTIESVPSSMSSWNCRTSIVSRKPVSASVCHHRLESVFQQTARRCRVLFLELRSGQCQYRRAHAVEMHDTDHVQTQARHDHLSLQGASRVYRVSPPDLCTRTRPISPHTVLNCCRFYFSNHGPHMNFVHL